MHPAIEHVLKFFARKHLPKHLWQVDHWWDCGLVHVLNFRVKKGKVQFQASRDERATSAKRREKKKRAAKADRQSKEE